MKSNLSAKETLYYNNREKSEVIFIKNLTGENVSDVERQMVTRQKLFTGRAKNLTAHIIISPGIEDGKGQTRLDWKEIGESFLKKAGLTSYQSIAYLHKDKEHFHLHIVANRIDAKGKIYRQRNELVMSQRLGDEIATERGLKRAPEIMRERKLATEIGIKIDPEAGLVAQIRKVAAESVVQAWSRNAFDQKKYFDYIKAQGYNVKLFFKKDNNELRGYAVGKKGERLIKASQIGSEFTLRRLQQEVPGSKPSVNFSYAEIREVLEANFQKVIGKGNKFEPRLFLDELRAAGHTVKEYYNKDTGKIRGYGLEINNIIVNSSEIGSEVTLTNLKKRCEKLRSPEAQHSKRRWKPVELEPEPILQHKEETSISRELKRTIDIQLITQDLRDLTSGHRYRSQDDFVKAVEEKGYHVHLRYDNGSLSGYTIHKGTEHYHDHEIGTGQFQLQKLFKLGTVRKFNFESRVVAVQTASPEITGISLEDSLRSQSSTHTETPNASDAALLHFVEHESKKKKESERERIRQVIAKELTAHVHSLIENRQSFTIEKYFDRLQVDGYKITRHFGKETGSIRGYSLEKYGFYFHASEVGKEFTLTFIKNNHDRKTRNVKATF